MIGPRLLWADVYATAALARGPTALAWLDAVPGYEALPRSPYPRLTCTYAMTTPEIDLLRRLYVDEAMTISQVAARLGVAAQTVHNRLVAARIPRRPSPSAPRVDVRDAEIRRLYVGQQLSAVQIAAHLGCGTSTVYDRLAGLGIARRSTSGSRSVRPPADELRQLYELEGERLRQIAQRIAVGAPSRATHLTA